MTDNTPYAPPKSNLIAEDASNIEEEPKTYSFKGRIGRVRYIYLTFVTLVSAAIMMLAFGSISALLAVPLGGVGCLMIRAVYSPTSINAVLDYIAINVVM